MMCASFALFSCDNNDGSSSSESSSSSSSSSSEESSSEESSSEEVDDGMWKSNASAETIAKAEELLDSKIRLTYNEDGSFKVLFLADLHMDVANYPPEKIQRVKDRIKEIVDRVDPDFCILTGDNTIKSSTPEKLKANIDACVGYLEEKGIPWCHVYGNHDHEGALMNSIQMTTYQSYEYCVSKMGTVISRPGTYALGVYNEDGSLGSVIYCFNSGAYISVGYNQTEYAYINDKQIEWYKETSELLEEYNNGEKVKGIMAFHIPLIENYYAYENKDNTELVYEYDGGKNEQIASSKVDTELYETALERGDIVAIVTGHDHKNDYMYNYQGIKLCSSPNLSELIYYSDYYSGARVLDLNASTLDNVPTYVEHLMDRGGLDVEDYGALDTNTVITDFEGEMPYHTTSGWSGNILNGYISFEAVDGVGALGSKGLKLSRDVVGNFEFTISMEPGKLNGQKYLVVWMDLTNIEFKKASVGVVGNDGVKYPFRTHDNHSSTKFYYLADGSEEWTTLTLGGDGCFGSSDGAKIKGKKGYFAFSIDAMRQGNKQITENELITGFYFYADILDETYANVAFYIDNISLVDKYESDAEQD